MRLQISHPRVQAAATKTHQMIAYQSTLPLQDHKLRARLKPSALTAEELSKRAKSSFQWGHNLQGFLHTATTLRKTESLHQEIHRGRFLWARRICSSREVNSRATYANSDSPGRTVWKFTWVPFTGSSVASSTNALSRVATASSKRSVI